jgi:hypothetical protein
MLRRLLDIEETERDPQRKPRHESHAEHAKDDSSEGLRWRDEAERGKDV